MNEKLFADGIHDDTAALQELLDCKGEVRLAPGDYRLTSALVLRSDTHILADGARLFLDPAARAADRGFLLTTVPGHAVRNFSIDGGIWDAGYSEDNFRVTDLFDPAQPSGIALNFISAGRFTLRNMTVRNAGTYFMRFGKAHDFRIENITLEGDGELTADDGLHFGGGTRNGTVKGITARGRQTGGNLIALNSDENYERFENIGLEEGDIEKLSISDITAENCRNFISLQSVNSEIRNISVENVSGGCRGSAINMDAGRGSKTPLFYDVNKPKGVGCIENARFSGFNVRWTEQAACKALIICETEMDELEIEGVSIDRGVVVENRFVPTLLVTNLYQRVMRSPLGKSIVIHDKPIKFEFSGDISNVKFTVD